MPPEIRVRRASERDALDVRRVLDAAMLAYDRLDDRIRSGEVFVAVEGEREPERDDEPVLGALVLSGNEIEAVAVRRARRDRGIGRALVEAAAGRRGDLTAEFDGGVRAFYEALGFEVERVGENRFRSVLRPDR
jgi:GNAT superfamily N-acetyltransferase